MKKKILLILTMVIAATLLIGSSASAWGPPPPEAEGDVIIELGEITIDGDTYYDETATFSGTISVTAYSSVELYSLFTAYASAEILALAGLVNPNGGTVTTTTVVDDSDYDDDHWGWPKEASVNLTQIDIDWSFDYTFDYDDEGNWKVFEEAYGSSEAGYYYWEWVGPPTYFEKVFVPLDEASDYDYRFKSFFVGVPHPEFYFRLTALGADGSVEYPSGAMTPMPIKKELVAVGKFWTGNGNYYRFVVPEGTVITHERTGEKALCAYIYDISGNTLYSTYHNMTFSNPVEVYVGVGDFVRDKYHNLVGGTWELLGAFTEIDENGEATLD